MTSVTFDQLRVFVTIVNEGSFAAAARHLHRTQSAITYAIHKLEEQSGLELFDRNSYRPSLTKAGRSLLPFARKVLSDVAEYQLRAEGISRGLEASLAVSISQFAPQQPVLDALFRFQQTFPNPLCQD